MLGSVWKKTVLAFAVALALSSIATAEEARAGALPAKWAENLQWRSIGPANMGGRITDIAVYEKDPCIWWVASASGGLLKTTNNGTTFEHQFEHEATVSIGDVTVAQSDPKIVYVGTGEANPRNSVSWGNGVYRSDDGGKNWEHRGLDKTFQIGRIAIHPEDPDTVYVAALGRLWGPNEERGVFKSTDGGKTWEKVLYIDDKTGVIDIQMDPSDPDTLLAAAYERRRDGFDSNAPATKMGPGSGLYKTTDGGKNWKKLTKGLPTGELGRIGIAYYRKNPDTVFVVLESDKIAKAPDDAPYLGVRGEDADAGAKLTEVTKDSPAAEAGLEEGDIVLSVEDATVLSYLDFLEQVRSRVAGDDVKVEVARDRKRVVADVTFGEQPKPDKKKTGSDGAQPRPRPRRARGNSFSSGLGGQRENLQRHQGPKGYEHAGVYKSTDGGESWVRVNSVNPRPMYFSQIRVDPSDDNYLYVLGTSLYRSKDGGETFTDDGGGDDVHVDHHALWIDPKDGRHVILGNDGGLYVTNDRMENWDQLNHFAIGQFYHVTVDNRPNYRVYGGMQDNGSWGGPARVRDGGGPINEDWFRVGGGDGFICRVDPDDPDQLYFESQNGGMGRYNLRTGERGFMRPQRRRGGRGGGPKAEGKPRREQYRFNWKTPFLLSHHNSQIVYSAGNYVFRSFKKGEHMTKISQEITRTKRGSATALAESHHEPGVLFVGTDDGAMWMTPDGGHEWTKIIDFPDDEATEDATEETPADEAKHEPKPDKPRAGSAARREARESSRPRRGRGPGRMIEMIKRMDANDDGKIQRDEVPERMQRMFDRIDRNGDDVIDDAELKAMAERMRGGRRGGPPPAAELTSLRPSQELAGRMDSAPRDDPPKKAAPRKTAAPDAKPADDPISGEWEAQAISDQMDAEQAKFNMTLKLSKGGKVTGSMESFAGDVDLEGTYDSETAKILFSADSMNGMSIDFEGTLEGARITGEADMGGGMFSFGFEADRKSRSGASVSTGDTTGDEAPVVAKPLTELLPGPRWVSSIETSHFDKDRVYVTLDGHRSDDDEPYLFATDDGGKTWRSIRGNLPTEAGSTRVLREDIENEDLLYLGCEFGAWVSIDRGKSWTRLDGKFPTVAVHEFAIHPTTGEVVLATHGRSLWVLDVTPLRQLSPAAVAAPAKLFKPVAATYWRSEPGRGGDIRRFVGQNPPSGARIAYSLGKRARGISLKIKDPSGETIRELDASADPGLHAVLWDLEKAPPQQSARPAPGRRGRRFRRRGKLVESGKYVVALTVDGQTYSQELLVETDPEHPDYRPWEMEQWELDFFNFQPEEIEPGVPEEDGI